MNRKAAFACFNLAIAVALGALAAHYLKAELDRDSLLSFQTGVRYHIYHGLALLILSLQRKKRNINSPWRLMAFGMLLFSLSIYLLSTRGLLLPTGSAAWLGPITPMGGLFLISSWLWLGFIFLKK
ncbi:MAG: DUF423 domain-containing protein [Flavobacteriales bacterium]|nr:DUF423 domain-containing protein [Flavobacteriales bacterium]